MGSSLPPPLSAAPIVATDVAAASSRAPTGLRLTLHAKGIITFVALVAYLTLIGLYVAHEQGRLVHAHGQLEQLHAENQLLTKVNTALTHFLVTLQTLLNSGFAEPRFNDIQLDLAALAPNLPELKATFPEIASTIGRFERNLSGEGEEREHDRLIVLRDSGQRFAAELEKLETRIQGQSDQLSKEYLRLIRNFMIIASLAFLLGLAVFGSAVMVFFSRLASDIKSAEARTAALIEGYRGKPLDVARHDEVGTLMEDINRLQHALRHREQQQEISHQHRFYREKMAAVGSLAAAVAHEINNPINSISGIAQHTIDSIRSHKRMDDEALCGNAEFILKQTERIALIVRQIADVSAPRSADPELLNINELVQTTCSFIRYDKRFCHIEIMPDLDFDLPAVRAVADHLTQVLMNLLINAADATQEVTGRKPMIRVATRRADDEIMISVSDNGQGMDSTVLAHAFEQSFTTKPAGKGRGIGLYLCKTLIEEIGGRIDLESTVGAGTTVQVRLQSRHGQLAAA
jgi:two-component system NtrC family sensor kinase